MHAVIAHCWTGSPADGWYPAAAAALRSLGYLVTVPALPDADTPDLSAWVQALNDAVDAHREDLLLIGHSLGALAALHWAATSSSPTRIAGLFVVAPPLHPTGIPEVDRFLTPAIDLYSARRNVTRAAALVSDGDQYLRPTALAVASRLQESGFETLVAPGKGHFSPASGLKALPELTAWAATLVKPHP